MVVAGLTVYMFFNELRLASRYCCRSPPTRIQMVVKRASIELSDMQATLVHGTDKVADAAIRN